MTDPELKAVLDDSDVQRLHLEPGDAVVVLTDQLMSMAMVRDLTAHIEAMFPGHQCLILDGGTRLATVGA